MNGIKKKKGKQKTNKKEKEKKLVVVEQERRTSRRSGGQPSRAEGSSASSGGISNLLRWFKRPSRSYSQAQESLPVGRSSGGKGMVHSRSLDNGHSDRWRATTMAAAAKNQPLSRSGSGHSLNDSLSTASSFAFIRTPESPVLTGGVGRNQSMNGFRSRQSKSVEGGNGSIIRQKYGLYADVEEVNPDSGGQPIEGAAIRAMRTEWESEIKQMELRTAKECETETNPFYVNYGRNKKRPAPPPPVLAATASATGTDTGTGTGTAPAPSKRSSFIHVPGKRRAPSPPPPCQPASASVNNSQFNIPVIAPLATCCSVNVQTEEILPPAASNVPDSIVHDSSVTGPNVALNHHLVATSNSLGQPGSPKFQNKFNLSPSDGDVVEGAQALIVDEDPLGKRIPEWEAASKWNDLSGNLNGNQNTVLKTQHKFLLQDSAVAASFPSDSAHPAFHKPLTLSNNIVRDSNTQLIGSVVANEGCNVRAKTDAKTHAKTDAKQHSVSAGSLPEVIHNTPVLEAAAPNSNGILKLEDGILRPVKSVESRAWEPEQKVEYGSADQKERRTLPLKPWYKRHGSKINAAQPSAESECKSVQRHAKDSSFHPDEWMPEVPYFRRSLFPTARGSTLGRKTPLARSGSDGNNSKRKSLLVNISQLDREAEEIIRKEREKAMQRKRVENEQFYTLPKQVPAPAASSAVNVIPEPSLSGTLNILSSPDDGEASPAASTRQLINMFNSFNKTRVTVNPCFTVVEAGQPEPAPNPLAAVAALPAEVGPASPSNLPATKQVTPSAPRTENVATQGGARPKRPPVHSTAVNNPSDHSLNGLVEGVGRWSSDEGWTCHICTLLNPNSRLLCNACTALKPHRSILPASDSKKTDHNSNHLVAPKASVAATSSLSSTSNNYLKWEGEMKKYFNRPVNQVVEPDKVAPVTVSADGNTHQCRAQTETTTQSQTAHLEALDPSENIAQLKSPHSVKDVAEAQLPEKDGSHRTMLQDSNDHIQKEAKIKSQVPDPEALRQARLNFFSSQSNSILQSKLQLPNEVQVGNGDVSRTPPMSPKGGRKVESTLPCHTKFASANKSIACLRDDTKAVNEVKQRNGDMALLPPLSPKAVRKTELMSTSKVSSGCQTHTNSLQRLKNGAGRTNQTTVTATAPHSNSSSRFENDVSSSCSSNGSSLRRLLVSSPSGVANSVMCDVDECTNCTSSLQLSRYIQQRELATRGQPPSPTSAQSRLKHVLVHQLS